MKNFVRIIGTGLLSAFGLLTLFLSASILFDWFGIREQQGNYIQFIVLTNFVCSWLYLFAAYGMLHSYRWASHVLIFVSLALSIVLIILMLYISKGGVYETKTPLAMLFRIIVTGLFAALAYYTFGKQKAMDHKTQHI